MGANKKATAKDIKPRKPPRPHIHHPNGPNSESPKVRSVITELLSQSKRYKKTKKAQQGRPRNYSDPVMIEAKTLNRPLPEPESPNTVNTDISSHSSNTSLSSLRLSQNAHSLGTGNGHRKPPFVTKQAKQTRKESEE